MRTLRLSMLAFAIGFGLAIGLLFGLRFLVVAVQHGGIL